MRSALSVGLLAVVLLAGCAATAPLTPEPTPSPTSTERAEVVTPDELLVDVEVSPVCLEAMRGAQGPVEPDGVDAMFTSIVTACTTPAEFVSAFRLVIAENPPPNPAARDFFVGLIATCLNSMERGIESDLCDTVEAKGWLDDLPPNDPTITHPKPGTD
jgi:hypothetical protein